MALHASAVVMLPPKPLCACSFVFTVSKGWPTIVLDAPKIAPVAVATAYCVASDRPGFVVMLTRSQGRSCLRNKAGVDGSVRDATERDPDGSDGHEGA